MTKPALSLRFRSTPCAAAMLMLVVLVSLVLLLAQGEWATPEPAWQTLTMDICSSSSTRRPVLSEQKAESVNYANPEQLPASRGRQTSR